MRLGCSGCLAWACVTLALMAGSTGALADPVTLRAAYGTVESPPWQMGNGNKAARQPGVAIVVVKEAAAACDVALQLSRLPGERLFEDLRIGEMDAGFLFSFKPDRLSFGVYPMLGDKPDTSLRITDFTYAFYARKDSSVAWDGKTLSGASRPAGATFSWSIADDLKKMGIPVETAATTANNFAKLTGERIDSFATQIHVGDAYIASHQLADSVIRLEPPISSKPYYLIFGKGWYAAHQEAAACIWRNLAELRETKLPALLLEYARDEPVN